MTSSPFVIDVRKGARLMSDMIERGIQSSTVPVFPWNALARVLKMLPTSALARATGARGLCLLEPFTAADIADGKPRTPSTLQLL